MTFSKRQKKSFRRELVSLAGCWHQMGPFRREKAVEMFLMRLSFSRTISSFSWADGDVSNPLAGVSVPRLLRARIRVR